MRVEWYGHSSFRLQAPEATVFIDPFGDMSPAAAHGLVFEYPPIEGVSAELVLVTHEHLDHNAVEAIEGDPPAVRSTAGRHDSPVGEVLAVASEHDEAAGTERGPNAILAFDLDGNRVVHLGDFGQTALRDEQAAAIGSPDLLFIPVGGGPTIGAEQAAVIVERLDPRWVVPMHYRTTRISFLEPVDEFLERMANVVRLSEPAFDTAELDGERPLVVVPAAP